MEWARTNVRWLLAGGVAAAIAVAGLAIASFTAGGDGGGGEVSSVGETVPGPDTNGVSEGIQVHGDWVIEIRNADGTLADRREFENALTPQGQLLLTTALARQFHPGVWGVLVSGGPNPQPCGNAAPACLMREPIDSALNGWSATHFTTLTVAAQQNPTRLELQGNFDAPQDGAINIVQAINCFGGPDPALCNNVQVITSTNIADVNVVAGQQVLVTVRITFS